MGVLVEGTARKVTESQIDTARMLVKQAGEGMKIYRQYVEIGAQREAARCMARIECLLDLAEKYSANRD